jgi:phage terminase large subunit-like protein
MTKPQTKRIGRQQPTVSSIKPYTATLGDRAVKIYNTRKRAALEWQRYIINALLAEGKDKLWIHSKFGLAVPRRNGKNEIIIMREAYGLLSRGEKILHTAHRTTTEHSAWERLYEWFKASKNDVKIESLYRAYGLEHIILTNGGEIRFRTRTSKGGIGEGYDLLVIDEAQEYQDDQEQALKYVVTDSANPQTIFTGTPPTQSSSGTVFTKYRADVLESGRAYGGWAEWSVPKETDPHDVDAWYEANPSMGIVLSERAVQDEIGSDDLDFNIQRLGYWVTYNVKSAISRKEWEALTLGENLMLKGKLSVGIKYNHSGESVSMSIAAKQGDRIFVETLDCRKTREGSTWIVEFLSAAQKSIGKIIIDGASGQTVLAEELHKARIRGIMLPTVKQIITANSVFETAMFEQRICHKNQPSLSRVVANCEKRAIGSGGGFGYKSIADAVDISIMDSMILAHFGTAFYSKEKKKQVASY